MRTYKPIEKEVPVPIEDPYKVKKEIYQNYISSTFPTHIYHGFNSYDIIVNVQDISGNVVQNCIIVMGPHSIAITAPKNDHYRVILIG